MQSQLSSLLFLGKISTLKRARDQATTDTAGTSIKNKPGTASAFIDWLSPKPKEIAVFPGEVVLFQKGTVLVTDTRMAFIDPLDCMLKTYMFEHMISMHKQFHRTTTLNRRLCKGLLLISFLALLGTVAIDLIDDSSRRFILIYVPLLFSITLGLKVWRDMKPAYVMQWKMRDGTVDKIATEPMLRERLMNNTKREVFMDELAMAMNTAITGKAWWPENNNYAHLAKNDQAGNPHTRAENLTDSADTSNSAAGSSKDKPALTLVTESYL